MRSQSFGSRFELPCHDKIISCYSPDELRKLIAQGTIDERDMIYVFLGAGLRDKDVCDDASRVRGVAANDPGYYTVKSTDITDA